MNLSEKMGRGMVNISCVVCDRMGIDSDTRVQTARDIMWEDEHTKTVLFRVSDLGP